MSAIAVAASFIAPQDEPAVVAVVAAGAGTTIVSTVAGRFYGIASTATGTGAITCYDNAAAASGVILGATTSSPTVGVMYASFGHGIPTQKGITCKGSAGSPSANVIRN